MTATGRREREGLLSHIAEDEECDLELEELADEESESERSSPCVSIAPRKPQSWWRAASSRHILPLFRRAITTKQYPGWHQRRSRPARLPSTLSRRLRLAVRIIFMASVSIQILIMMCATMFPSYTLPPRHYSVLRERVDSNPSQLGVANINNEKVFIAASLYDPEGSLTSGDWAHSVTQLIDMLGPANVHLSLYQNDADPKSKEMFWDFEQRLGCNTTFVEEDMDYEALPHVKMPDGTQRLKRMEFLAEVRNRALAPLVQSETRFDKLLYLNDVIFDPVDAANLLFSTNVDHSGRSQYRAACAVDFWNPFKFYDTYATRDTGGFEMGVIFYPWFTGAGDATSRNDVLSQTDAVRVKSCWGGMVAFDAQWFQYPQVEGAITSSVSLPLRFRAERDSFWDSSECCLIHADLAALTSGVDDKRGIYMNPYIRVAYTKQVLDWLWVTRRVERLYPPIQAGVNWLIGRPTSSSRRTEEPGTLVTNRIWVPDDEGWTGKWENVSRLASPGGFCGNRRLTYLITNPESGEKHWKEEIVPDGA